MTEETFARELERRADQAFGGVHGAPLTFEAVRGRAHGIRRRRRAAAAGAVAAVAAVVALAVLLPTVLTGGANRSDGPDPAPKPPAAPGASVLHDGVVTRPDGSTVPVDVDNANVSQLAVLTDGRIVVALQEPFAVRVYTPDGDVQADYPVQTNAITTSADDTAVAWMGADFRIRVLASGAPGPAVLAGVPMPGESPGSIDAVLDADHLLVGDWNTTTGEVTPDGYREITTTEPLRVTDVSPDGELWAVQYPDRSDAQFGCAGLYDPEPAVMVARSCDTALLRFAPDGEHLSGALGDGGTWGSVEVFDLDLELVGTYEPDGEGVVKDWAWADSEYLLLAVGEGAGKPSWTLVRSSLDAESSEVVEGPVDGPIPEFASEFVLSE